MSRVKPEDGFKLNRELQLGQVSPSALWDDLKKALHISQNRTILCG